MSKNYLGRCAAVGIAGLTAMSSLAIVASAASQTTLIYELEYKTANVIGMKDTAGYATKTNRFCVAKTPTTDAVMTGGFKVDLSKLADLTNYNDVTYTKYGETDATLTKTTTEIPTATEVWGTDICFQDDGNAKVENKEWTYQRYTSNWTLDDAAFEDLYEDRNSGLKFYFKSASERDAAMSAMKSKLTGEYDKIAKDAYSAFCSYIDSQVKIALDNIQKDYETTCNNATGSDKEIASKKKNAQSLKSAATSVVNKTASIIKEEFRNSFVSTNFRVDTDGFEKTEEAVVFAKTFAGVTNDATFGGADGTTNKLTGAKYYNASTKYNASKSYAFKGEIQLATNYTVANANNLCISGNDWLNFEVIDYSTNSGGNTTPGGNTTNNDTKKDDTTTTVTTWYPDSAAYRAASEVSYLGKNGSWYTSASAATTYGGGYTGTSKNSNYSAVNSANNGKAIYFDSTSGTYTTTATSYSYVVKEATTTNDDPYYNYFFGNKNNNTTTSVPAGSPAISGASKYAGWTNISAYITNRAKSGATYTINMNDGTVVPAAVLAAAKAKNVTLVFANDNGSKVTVKPGKVSTTSDLNVAVTYNVKDIKSSLVKKAKKVNKGTVSTAQVRIGTDGSVGGTETVTVKFSTKRAGCTVKAYRLTESGSLKKEASGTVASTGRVNLNLTKGGSYLLVVIDD